jgi:large subunit ribosomal protein L25
MINLKVKKREPKENLDELRGQELIPAIVYGPKQEALSISIEMSDFRQAWRKAGESSVIVLQGLDQDIEALVQDMDVHPVSGQVRHVDFYAIERDKKIHVNVPLEFIGTSPAVKELGGTLIKVLHEVEVETLPRDIPKQIEVDISLIKDFDTHFHVKDLKLPEAVSVLAQPDDVVALVSEGKEEVEEEAKTDVSEVEIEKKGKEKEEESEEEKSDSK